MVSPHFWYWHLRCQETLRWTNPPGSKALIPHGVVHPVGAVAGAVAGKFLRTRGPIFEDVKRRMTADSWVNATRLIEGWMCHERMVVWRVSLYSVLGPKTFEVRPGKKHTRDRITNMVCRTSAVGAIYCTISSDLPFDLWWLFWKLLWSVVSTHLNKLKCWMGQLMVPHVEHSQALKTSSMQRCNRDAARAPANRLSVNGGFTEHPPCNCDFAKIFLQIMFPTKTPIL